MTTAMTTPVSSFAPDTAAVTVPWDCHTRRPSLLVVDDDPLFRSAIAAFGKRMGFYVVTHDSAADLATLPHDGEIDVAIVDYDLGGWTGAQLAVLFRETAVLIVSSSLCSVRAGGPWPTSVGAFVAKSRGIGRIIAAAVELNEKRRMRSV